MLIDRATRLTYIGILAFSTVLKAIAIIKENDVRNVEKATGLAYVAPVLITSVSVVKIINTLSGKRTTAQRIQRRLPW